MSPIQASKQEQVMVGRPAGMARRAPLVGVGALAASLAQPLADAAPTSQWRWGAVAASPEAAIVSAAQTRGVRVRPVGAESGGLTILPADESPPQPGGGQSGIATPVGLEAAPGAGAADAKAGRSLADIGGGPIRIASLDGETAWFPALQRQRPVVLVDAKSNPDLTWDPKSHEVLAGPDVVARDISAADLTGVVDQALAVAWLKRRQTEANQPIKLLSVDELHTRGSRIDIEVQQLSGRYLVLFDLSGTGAVQLLYPLGADPMQRADPTYAVTFQVREPFGADYVVAVTAAGPMPELERSLRESARQIDVGALASAVDGLDARIGYVRIFTTP